MKILCFLTLVVSGTLCAVVDYKQLATLLHVRRSTVKGMLTTIAHRRHVIESSWGSYYHILPQMIRDRNYAIGCEVGVSFGGHSESILANTQVKKMYCIDPYLDHLGVAAAWGIKKKHWQTCWDVFFYYVQDRLSCFGDRVIQIRKPSSEAFNMIADGSLDFIFIDGDHAYEAVLEDLHNYYNKVRSGGLISGDDYNLSGVGKAVNEFFSKRGLQINQHPEQERFWWVEKP